MKLKWDEVQPEEKEMIKYPLIQELISEIKNKSEEMKQHVNNSEEKNKKNLVNTIFDHKFKMILALNKTFRKLLFYTDFANLTSKGSVACLVSKCRGLFFSKLKLDIVWKYLRETNCSKSSTFEFKVSRQRHLKLKNSGECDIDGRRAIFSQVLFLFFHFIRRYNYSLYHILKICNLQQKT